MIIYKDNILLLIKSYFSVTLNILANMLIMKLGNKGGRHA